MESNQNVAGNKVQSQENSSEDAKKPKVAPRKRKAATAIKDENKTETKTKVTAAVSIKKPKLSPKVRKLGPINGVVPDPDIEDCWKPINWEQMIKNIREMRKDRSAPVDTMGCHRCSDDNADEKVNLHMLPIISFMFIFSNFIEISSTDSTFSSFDCADAVQSD